MKRVLTDNGQPNQILLDTATTKRKNVGYFMAVLLHTSNPKKVITDNEGCFQSKELKNVYETLGIEQIMISAYHPESNGIAERLIGTIKSLAARTDGTPLQKILKAVKSYNEAPHSTTTYTPQELMYVEKKYQETAEDILNEERLRKKQERLQDAREKIQARKERTQETTKRTGREESYEVGDAVQIHLKTNDDKRPVWSEPLLIRKVNNNTKTVAIFRTGQEQMRHFNQMKKFFGEI